MVVKEILEIDLHQDIYFKLNSVRQKSLFGINDFFKQSRYKIFALRKKFMEFFLRRGFHD